MSVPCVEWFAEQNADGLRALVAVQAGSGDAWYRWAGLDGRVVSIEEFGRSGSSPQLLRHRGIRLDAVIAAAHALATPALVTN